MSLVPVGHGETPQSVSRAARQAEGAWQAWGRPPIANVTNLHKVKRDAEIIINSIKVI